MADMTPEREALIKRHWLYAAPHISLTNPVIHVPERRSVPCGVPVEVGADVAAPMPAVLEYRIERGMMDGVDSVRAVCEGVVVMCEPYR